MASRKLIVTHCDVWVARFVSGSRSTNAGSASQGARRGLCGTSFASGIARAFTTPCSENVCLSV
jgi:hypothetical protein